VLCDLGIALLQPDQLAPDDEVGITLPAVSSDLPRQLKKICVQLQWLRCQGWRSIDTDGLAGGGRGGIPVGAGIDELGADVSRRQA
jgi:hypothetical protein